ncbi:MAG: tRNA uridine-5-carboxymethylaminomethyl(34) synthesis GTPase MnmE [Pseudobdellovibrionaceae bacterium]|nr:tRNA uridine-5-carboxymethylaminomethyl(34) synthesis GTPase MnmE [Bdellovibrionales bacterium]USN46850.1 MAG: tRNA uridine-5-carboxymethylaminomethyl(34) synthesis GTPase MnmE [Pseudobdellovibrionaceae bacterium]
MFNVDRDADTVCALSTAPGIGGIAVLRVSGAGAWDMVRPLASSLPSLPESHRAYYCVIRDPENNEPIDEVLVTYFEKGRSFTGEQTVEVSCHGGQQVSQDVLTLIQRQGARLADRGEFTYRAFMNGRIDLMQAEAVLSLIESQNPKVARLSLRQLQGDLSRSIEEVIESLTWVMAHLEANIDFASEDIEVADVSALLSGVCQSQLKVSALVESYRAGQIVRDGLVVALVGPPNVGKSSLLNTLVGYERAIVTHLPGTTRDTVSERVSIEGVPIQFVDTAGLRETEDLVEKIGIEKTRQAVVDSDVLLAVVDLSEPNIVELLGALELAIGKEVGLIFNKSDLRSAKGGLTAKAAVDKVFGKEMNSALKAWLDEIPEDRIFLASAKSGEGINEIKQFLHGMSHAEQSDGSAIVLQARHQEQLVIVNQALERAIDLLEKNASPEFVLEELMLALRSLNELLGRRFDDEVMDRVFNEFCLGK